jgi:hypothetical protein
MLDLQRMNHLPEAGESKGDNGRLPEFYETTG